jgi:HSP20 family protein
MWFDLMSPFETDFPFFNEMGPFRSALESWFADSFNRDVRASSANRFPLVNIGETEQEFRIYVFAPGVDQKDLSVEIKEGLLTITGKRTTTTEKDIKESTIYRQERFNGEFLRTLSLPDSVDPDAITGQAKNGVITLILPKKAALQPKRVEVRAA